ncbi:MAG: Holliday junction resolvase RuvX [Bacteroidetes bacterium]|jgi:putative Holliday junction resolvase|nr:Holliday junction resolvase RuvX [Bacteroidota bacterium]
MTPAGPLERILGVDVGTRRIGLALSDLLGITAQPISAVEPTDAGWKALAELIARESVRLVVVGLPLNLKGERGKAVEVMSAFIVRLKATTGVEVLEWDERFTTTMAQRTMRDAATKKRREKRDGSLDSMAAAILLQSYLDSTKHSRVC